MFCMHFLKYFFSSEGWWEEIKPRNFIFNSAKYGRNMSSMNTEDSSGGQRNQCEEGCHNKIVVRQVVENILVQTHTVVDTGVDTNCTNLSLRHRLGKDSSPNTPAGFQGTEGSDNDLIKDNFLIITMDKEISVVESRRTLVIMCLTQPNS